MMTVSLLLKLLLGLQSIYYLDLDGFKMGKISVVNEHILSVTLFHHKLDVKTEVIMDDDILMNFGNIGSKTIFELDNTQQKSLLNKLMNMGNCFYIFIKRTIDSQFVLYQNYNSIIHLLTDMKIKDEVCFFFLPYI